MFMSSLPPLHLVITRMGIGVRNPKFYDDHIRLAGLTIAKSLSAQTQKDFVWVVAIDSRAPADVDDRIKALAPSVRTEVWRRDPFEVGINPIDRSRIKRLADGRSIITTRVDDDDFLHKHFTERLHESLRSCSIPAALTFRKGANLTTEGIYITNYPWIGLGLSGLSGPDLGIHAYSGMHTKMGEKAEEIGGEAITVDTPFPMWIRTWRLSSDSSLARGIRVDDKDEFSAFRPEDYGANEASIRDLLSILKEPEKVRDQGVFEKAAAPRMLLKSNLIRKVREMRKNPDHDRAEVEVLSQIMYLI